MTFSFQAELAAFHTKTGEVLRVVEAGGVAFFQHLGVDGSILKSFSGEAEELIAMLEGAKHGDACEHPDACASPNCACGDAPAPTEAPATEPTAEQPAEVAGDATTVQTETL